MRSGNAETLFAPLGRRLRIPSRPLGYEHFRSFLREYKVYEDAAGESMSILDFPASYSRATAKAQADLSAVTAELLTVWANTTTTERTSA